MFQEYYNLISETNYLNLLDGMEDKILQDSGLAKLQKIRLVKLLNTKLNSKELNTSLGGKLTF